MERAPTERSNEIEDKNPELERENHYEILYSPEIRAEYLTLTDRLISRIVEKNTDVAIFLDKSARPVAWLMDELWDTLAPIDRDTGMPIEKPGIKFLNIDREQWGAIVGRSEEKEGGINIDLLPEERLRELRNLYAPIAGVSKKSDVSLLTDKNVLVIDEVKMSGDTLVMSEEILRKAFPDANDIDGFYWMYGNVQRDQKSAANIGTKLPVWYSDTVVTGRLVGNRDTTKSNKSNSSRQRVGRYWLSAPFRESDEQGRKLKQEVKQLADDLREHRMIYKPSPEWSESVEPIESRINRINGIALAEYVKLRQLAHDDGELNRSYKQLYGTKRLMLSDGLRILRKFEG